MDEIPTVVVEPMPSTMLKHDDYVVLNRPYAVGVEGEMCEVWEGSGKGWTGAWKV